MAGGASGTRLLEDLREESILTAFTRLEGETRTNLAVIDPTSGEQTEINDRGPDVSEAEVNAFIDKLAVPGSRRVGLRPRGQRPAGRRRTTSTRG